MLILIAYLIGVIINVGWVIGFRMIDEDEKREPFWFTLLCILSSWFLVGVLFGTYCAIFSGFANYISATIPDIEEDKVEEN